MVNLDVNIADIAHAELFASSGDCRVKVATITADDAKESDKPTSQNSFTIRQMYEINAKCDIKKSWGRTMLCLQGIPGYNETIITSCHRT